MAKGMYQKWLEKDNLELLKGWKRNGLTDEQIAKKIGVAPRTLENWKAKYVQIMHALKCGKEQANFTIENKLFETAMKGNTTAMIFWLKNNWRTKYNDSALSPEELALARQRARKAKADADVAEYQAKELTSADSELTSVSIINDISAEGGQENASQTKSAD